MIGAGLSELLTAIQNGVTAANNLAQILTRATINSSSLRVSISGVSTTTGTVTEVDTGVGLTGGPITSTGTLAVSLSRLTNSLSSDVNLSNTSSYFDGPTVVQGTSGVWFASGTVTVSDTANARIGCKLWDGTTVIDSAQTFVPAGFAVPVSLSGILSSPASNIRISCLDGTNTTGKILANQSGNSKDSTITVMRIG